MITPSFGLTATERVLPKLALNFTIGALDSRVTFTRTTDATNPATYVNSSGYITAATDNEPRFDYNPVTLARKGLLIEESRENSQTYSQTYDNAVWTATRSSAISAAITSPDGTLNGYKIQEDSTASSTHIISHANISVTSGITYTQSVYAKYAGRFLTLYFASATFGNTNNSNAAIFNLQTGEITSQGASLLSASITPAGNGWYRCAVTKAATVTGNFALTYYLGTGASPLPSYSGDGTSGVYLYGTQMEVGAFATSYIPTTSAALTRNADVATMTGTNFSDWWQAGLGGATVQALPSTVSGIRPLIQFDDGTANEIIALRGNTTNPELVIVDGGSPQAQIDAGTIAANIAYNLGAAWNTDNCAAAVNGNATVTDTTATIPTVTQARLGSDGTNYLNGHLQTVRYWPQRIINAEVQASTK